jgi:hypothetical protein
MVDGAVKAMGAWFAVPRGISCRWSSSVPLSLLVSAAVSRVGGVVGVDFTDGNDLPGKG